MKQLSVIVKKEVIDNIRDKRTLFFSLVYGPILLPLIILIPMIVGIKFSTIDFDKKMPVSIVGQELAPNLIQFLIENNIVPLETPEGFRERVKQGDTKLVLEITAAYGEHLKEGKPAPLRIVYSSEKKGPQNVKRQLKILLNQYDRTISRLRMQARGFDHHVLDVINIVEEDLAESDNKRQVLATMLPFIVVFAMLMGGFYLATDITAGEREKRTLEPLLSLAISRKKLVFGKFLSIFSFVSFSGMLAIFSLFLIVLLDPSQSLRKHIDINYGVSISLFILLSPLSFFISSTLMAIATYTKSTKEAQTHLSIAMMVPMLPFVLLQFINIKATTLTAVTPLLSQYLLVGKVMAGEGEAVQIALSVVGTSTAAAALLFLGIWLFSRDQILD